jgi:hypothetical protein
VGWIGEGTWETETDGDVHEELFVSVAFDKGFSGIGGYTRQNGLDGVLV